MSDRTPRAKRPPFVVQADTTVEEIVEKSPELIGRTVHIDNPVLGTRTSISFDAHPHGSDDELAPKSSEKTH